MKTPEAVLGLRIPPRPQLSRLVRERVGDFASRRGIGGEDLEVFLSALGEAVANAIEHAGTTAPIELECRISDDRILATVQDEGVGFDHAAEMAAALPELSAERGRGLPIMRRCTDVFEVRTAPGQGTRVRIGRYLRGHAPAPQRNGTSNGVHGSLRARMNGHTGH